MTSQEPFVTLQISRFLTSTSQITPSLAPREGEGQYATCQRRIPTFNSSAFVVDAIESVLGQTYSNVEIIVVDDGSTDDTIAVTRRVLQQRAKNWQVLNLASNYGPSAARNAGYQAASGSWVQFLDSDDLLMPSKIEEEMSIAGNVSENISVIYSPWNWGFVTDKRIEWFGPVQRPFILDKNPIMCLAGGCRPLLGASLIRRAAVNQIGGFRSIAPFLGMRRNQCQARRFGAVFAAKCEAPQYLWRLRPERDLHRWPRCAV